MLSPLYPRYAVYFVPAADTAFYRFGAGLIGYDAFSGATVPFPADLVASVMDWAEVTRAARLYGFHATLKAPFSLARDCDEARLTEAFLRFVREPRPVPAIVPEVRVVSSFVAIVPAQTDGSLSRLAMDCVKTFDPFRAPLTPEGRARRNPARLTSRQLALLDLWGYPYVAEEFRFHMTLTEALPAGRRELVAGLISARFAEMACDALAVGDIALSRQDAEGASFRVIRHEALAPGAPIAQPGSGRVS